MASLVADYDDSPANEPPAAPEAGEVGEAYDPLAAAAAPEEAAAAAALVKEEPGAELLLPPRDPITVAEEDYRAAAEDTYDPFAAAGDDAGDPEPKAEEGAPAAKRPKVESKPGVLPPRPEGACDPELEGRLFGYLESNQNVVDAIRQNRDFHNPMLLSKIVDYFGIDDIATQYPPEVFDAAAVVARRAKDKKKPAANPATPTPAPP
eukprot:CAMPEP_0119285590 /NCGR_PEP_ID=MMETSP1329-20130426/32500_1 /TAXON_ID=114041 /ORGANISM="Genus nov. species nov., Strain RCC1024" /LENGTH=206 /DNA_ID=CAMNT_0007286301 /DNA_START=146 /DNA_END=762 /DNA_ORIENTATION=+